MCIIKPARIAISYIPPEWLREAPTLMEDTRSQLLQQGEGWKVHVVSDAEEFRALISHEIGRTAVPVIQGWQGVLAGGAEAAAAWFAEHRDEVTPAFWASLRLVRDGLIRITLFFVPDPSVIPEIQREIAKVRRRDIALNIAKPAICPCQVRLCMCIVLDGLDEIVEIVETCLNDHLARLGRTGKVAHGVVDVEHERGRKRSDLPDAGIRASGFVQGRRDPHHQRCNHGRDRRR